MNNQGHVGNLLHLPRNHCSNVAIQFITNTLSFWSYLTRESRTMAFSKIIGQILHDYQASFSWVLNFKNYLIRKEQLQSIMDGQGIEMHILDDPPINVINTSERQMDTRHLFFFFKELLFLVTGINTTKENVKVPRSCFCIEYQRSLITHLDNFKKNSLTIPELLKKLRNLWWAWFHLETCLMIKVAGSLLVLAQNTWVCWFTVI